MSYMYSHLVSFNNYRLVANLVLSIFHSFLLFLYYFEASSRHRIINILRPKLQWLLSVGVQVYEVKQIGLREEYGFEGHQE